MRRQESESLESRHITPAEGRTPQELRRVALTAAGYALDAGDEDQQVSALTEVLQVLGFKTKVPYEAADVYTDSYGRPYRKLREAERKKRRYEKGETEVTTTPIKGYSVRRHGLEPVCGTDRGTMRGYNRHITAYNTPCGDCVTARGAALDERWDRLGIPDYARDGVSLA